MSGLASNVKIFVIPKGNLIQREWQRLAVAVQSLDRQTMFVLTTAAALVVVQYMVGSRSFFRDTLGPYFVIEWRGLLSWGWWFSIQGITGFVLPVLSLTYIFKRRPAEIGLGAGDWKLALPLAGLYLLFVIAGAWILSDSASFQASYPHYQPAARDWRFFAIYEFLFLFTGSGGNICGADSCFSARPIPSDFMPSSSR